MARPPALIFTDLDGTLLDHDSYGWAPAAPLLKRLTAHRIPVVLSSSKTAAEMIPLRESMGLGQMPVICENGAGVVWAQPNADGAAYRRVRTALDALPPDLRDRFEGFGDMSSARLMALTGLSKTAAMQAADRAFSEPGLWHGPPGQEGLFCDHLAALGVLARRGGRFLTLSLGGTKADRMADITAHFGAPVTIALGDAPNDIEMLTKADYGIVVHNPHGPGLPVLPGEGGGRIRRTDQPGPDGWSVGLAALLSEIGIDLS